MEFRLWERKLILKHFLLIRKSCSTLFVTWTIKEAGVSETINFSPIAQRCYSNFLFYILLFNIFFKFLYEIYMKEIELKKRRHNFFSLPEIHLNHFLHCYVRILMFRVKIEFFFKLQVINKEIKRKRFNLLLNVYWQTDNNVAYFFLFLQLIKHLLWPWTWKVEFFLSICYEFKNSWRFFFYCNWKINIWKWHLKSTFNK